MMKNVMRHGLLLLALFAEAGLAGPAPTGPHVRVDLIAEVVSVAPGDRFRVLFAQDIDARWHTYWRNPGDSGDPPSIRWQAPEGVEVSGFSWPYPERIAYGPLMNFGYHDEVYLPFTVSVPADFTGAELTLEGSGRVLVCEEICIPERVSVTVTVALGETVLDASVRQLFDRADSLIPVALKVESRFQMQGDDIELFFGIPGPADNRVSSVEYFPYARDVIDNPAEQAYSFSDTGLTLTLQPGYGFDAAKADFGGIVVIHESSGGDAIVSSFAVGAHGTSAGAAKAPNAAATDNSMSLWLAVALAFAGGLILNLMPCVFPVLSIKVLSLVESSRQSGDSIRVHGLVYAAGVVLSFVLIALLLILLRLGGDAIGWGFQLQSPIVVGLLAYLFVLIGLNLMGAFEIGLSIMSIGSNAEAKGYTGSFATGVLATVVAAPCTAPFMGAAVGFALTQSIAVALTVFAALGAGMAAPYVFLCYSPGLLAKLPAPGAWMNTFRQVLAFPMFGSAVWLLWVFGIQTSVTGMMQALTGCLLLALCVWLVALRLESTGSRIVRALVVLAIGGGAVMLVWRQAPEAMVTPTPESTSVAGSGAAAGSAIAYSPDTLAAARENGAVLVNFTAAWCITCKVNEINALNTRAVQSALAKKGITYLKGDWTNEDPMITAALQAYGRSGVPLYLLYRPGAERAEVLPQILTQGIVLEALDTL